MPHTKNLPDLIKRARNVKKTMGKDDSAALLDMYITDVAQLLPKIKGKDELTSSQKETIQKLEDAVGP